MSEVGLDIESLRELSEEDVESLIEKAMEIKLFRHKTENDKVAPHSATIRNFRKSYSNNVKKEM